jgi:hypothetical protein
LERRRADGDATDPVNARRLRLVTLRMRVDFGGHADRVHGDARLGMLANRIELATRQPRIRRHGASPERTRREQRRDLRERVLGDDDDTVAGRYACLRETARTGVDRFN